jgi:transcriptional regulator with XRE-family HTH domain
MKVLLTLLKVKISKMQPAKKDKILKVIGTNLQKARKASGKEVKEVAAKLGLTTQAYGNLENGKTDFSITRVLEIAEILQTNYQQILNLDNTTTYNYYTTNNTGGNNGSNHANSIISEDNKALVLFLEKELQLLRNEMEKRLADKEKIIKLLEKN